MAKKLVKLGAILPIFPLVKSLSQGGQETFLTEGIDLEEHCLAAAEGDPMHLQHVIGAREKIDPPI